MDLCGHGTRHPSWVPWAKQPATNPQSTQSRNRPTHPPKQTNKKTALADRFKDSGVTLVLTAQTSGVLPAQACARYLEKPMIFAREKKPITMGASYEVINRDRVDALID